MEYSMTFLARGVWGSLPIVTMSGPDCTIFSTSRRILRRSMSRFLRTLAATPEPSLTSPRRMCSVPMYSWLKRCASWLASCITLRARSVNRSYIPAISKRERTRRTVDGRKSVQTFQPSPRLASFNSATGAAGEIKFPGSNSAWKNTGITARQSSRIVVFPPRQIKATRTASSDAVCAGGASSHPPSGLRLVSHQDLLVRHAGNGLEAAGQDHVRQLAAVAEVAVGGPPARVLAPQVLAEDVRRCHRRLVLLPVAPQRRHQDRHQVLHPLRQFRHAALPVGQLQLVLHHRLTQLQPLAAELLQGKPEVVGQPGVHVRHGLAVAALERLAQPPARVGPQLPPQLP